MDEAADAVAAGLGGMQDLFDGRAIAEAHGGAGRVDGELSREVARDLRFVGEQEPLEAADVVERAPVGQLAAGH